MLKKIPIILFLLFALYFFLKEKTFNDKIIYIGASLPKSGIMKSWGESVISGANSYFYYTNDNKLLEDKKIKFITYDDKYEPELTKDNFNKLIQNNHIFTLFGFVGTPTTKQILPLLLNKDIPFFATFSGASFLRNENNNNIVNFRSSYDEEVNSILEYLHKKRNINTIAVFYQNDDFGNEGYVSILNSLKSKKLTLVAQGSYKRNTLSINHAFNEIKNAKPQAIIMFGAYKANALFIKKAKEDKNLKNVIFSNISFADANSIIKELKHLKINTKNLIFSQVVPFYNNQIEVIKEYQTLMKKYYPREKLSFISLEAFLASKVLVNAISSITGSLTQKKLLKALKNSKKNILKGLQIEYKNKQLLNNIYLFEYKNNTFKDLK